MTTTALIDKAEAVNSRFALTEEGLRFGWQSFKERVGFWLGFTVVIFILAALPSVLRRFLVTDDQSVTSMVLLVFELIYRALLGIVVMRISLDIYDQERLDSTRILQSCKLLPKYIAGNMIYSVLAGLGLFLMMVGFITDRTIVMVMGGLLSIPGFIFAYMFFFVGYLIVDHGSGPIEALTVSKNVTEGLKADLAIFSVAILVVNLLGSLVALVGLLVSVPVTLMAFAHVYRRCATPAEELPA